MGYEALEELEIFRLAEQMSDRFYTLISSWASLDKETVGTQLVRAADSIGANIAESYGRFHYGDKLNFLYFARGSAYETKFWVRRARTRQLWTTETCDNALNFLDDFTKKLNAYIRDKRTRRTTPKATSPTDSSSNVQTDHFNAADSEPYE